MHVSYKLLITVSFEFLLRTRKIRNPNEFGKNPEPYSQNEKANKSITFIIYAGRTRI